MTATSTSWRAGRSRSSWRAAWNRRPPSTRPIPSALPTPPARSDLAAGTGLDGAVSRRDDDLVAARGAVRYARKRLDLANRDVVRGLVLCASRLARDDLVTSAAAAWVPSEAVVMTLSVRSGFDLLLGAVDWPPGSEVVCSAVGIPRLATIVRSHGHVPVSVDLCPDTQEVDPIALESACTEQTRAVVIARLFGARSDLSAVASFAAARGLLLIEDCAQCYDGVDRRGGPDDDLTTFRRGRRASESVVSTTRGLAAVSKGETMWG